MISSNLDRRTYRPWQRVCRAAGRIIPTILYDNVCWCSDFLEIFEGDKIYNLIRSIQENGQAEIDDASQFAKDPGASIPPETMMHSPPVSDFPPIFKIFFI